MHVKRLKYYFHYYNTLINSNLRAYGFLLPGKLVLGSRYFDLKGRIYMGAHKKVSRAKSPVSIRDPHYQEYDIQKERNIQKPLPRITQ